MERKTVVKFLGLFRDEKLTWVEHINYVKTKMSNAIYAIHVYNIRDTNTSITHIVFHSYKSPFDVWYNFVGCSVQYDLNKLKMMQKKTVQTIYKTEYMYNAHTYELFYQLSVLKYEDLYNMKLQSLCINVCI